MSSPIDKVLTCSTLPSLPGVAMKVLELTRDRNVSINALAETVQSDPALATKVLKTVNSSFYGLSTPCPSIPRAMSMLGLNTVKSIVLGFSLVDFTKNLAGGSNAFDLLSYWRRAIYSAAAARALAKETRRCDPEEAFVGALVADIGMLASLSALRDDYMKALEGAPEDHDDLVMLERDRLGFDHAQVGNELATRWRLPGQLQASIGCHHSESNAPPAYADMVRCVILGRLAAASLTYKEPKRKLGAYLVQSEAWFGMTREQARELVQATAKNAAELSKLLELKTGNSPDVGAILAEAQDQIVMTQVELQKQTEELTRKTVTDGLTGAFNRAYFNEQLPRDFASAQANGKAMGVLFIDGDRFKSINDGHGHAAGDAVLKELALRAQQCVGKLGTVCRYGGEEFAIIIPGADSAKTARMGELIRRTMEQSEFDLTKYDANLPKLRVTISLGACAYEPGMQVSSGDVIVQAADAAVYAAKKSGRNRVCVGKIGGEPVNVDGSAVQLVSEAKAPGAAPGVAGNGANKGVGAKAGVAAGAAAKTTLGTGESNTILIVEDDPLAAKLMELLFSKRSDAQVSIVPSGEKAMELLGVPGRAKPGAVIADMNLPGITGINLVKLIGAKYQQEAPPVIIVSAGGDERVKSLAMKGGAALFMNKGDLCTNFDASFEQIKRVIAQHATGQQRNAA